LIQAVALIAAAVIGAAPAAPRAQPTPCWETLFMDWADGRVGEAYTLACYRTAIARLNGDRLTYGSAAADLRRLVDRSLANLPSSRRAGIGPDTLIFPSPERANAAGVGPTWTWQDTVRIAFAAVLAALLVAWVVARVRRT
jgi:hypothetical protein